MAAKKRITHQDVARAAGVSTAVVSYVINNGPRPTSPEVRERVLTAVRELDYHPNAVARSLRARRTNTIGYVVYDYNAMDVFMSTYSAHILTGLTAELKLHQQYALVYPMQIGEDLRAFEMLLRSERLDGVVVRLVEDAPATDALLELVAGSRVPCVCIERPGAPRFGLAAVTYDDRQGAYTATSYLIERGHRRIAHLSGDQRYSTARARLDGYRAALAEHGLPDDPALILGGDDWSPAVAEREAARLLAQPERASAIFVASDDLALRLLEVLRARGLRVPADLALIGFDDVSAGAECNPPLTTMHIPLQELGRRAVNQLLCLVEDPEGAIRPLVDMPVELVRRGSV